MKLMTIQKREVYESLLNGSPRYIADPALMDNPEFLNSYQFMISHLEAKSPCPHGVKIPIWAWYKMNGKQEFDYSTLSEAERRDCILMELEVPDDLVLLSDYSLWHYVLNNMWIDDSQNYDEWESMHEWFDSLPFSEQDKLTRASWEQIFDTTPVHTDWIIVGDNVQAVFWELKREYIVDVFEL